MKFAATAAPALLSLLATSHGAAAAGSAPSFRIEALNPDAPFHGQNLTAYRGGIYLDAPEPTIRCEGGSQDYATFFMEDDLLYLQDEQAQHTQVSAYLLGPEPRKVLYGDPLPIFEAFNPRPWRQDDAGNVFWKDGSKDWTLGACAIPGLNFWGVYLYDQQSACIPFTAHAVVEPNPLTCSYAF